MSDKEQFASPDTIGGNNPPIQSPQDSSIPMASQSFQASASQSFQASASQSSHGSSIQSPQPLRTEPPQPSSTQSRQPSPTQSRQPSASHSSQATPIQTSQDSPTQSPQSAPTLSPQPAPTQSPGPAPLVMVPNMPINYVSESDIDALNLPARSRTWLLSMPMVLGPPRSLPAPVPQSSGNDPAPVPHSSGNDPAPVPHSSGNDPAPVPQSSGNDPAPVPQSSGNDPISTQPNTRIPVSTTPSRRGRPRKYLPESPSVKLQAVTGSGRSSSGKKRGRPRGSRNISKCPRKASRGARDKFVAHVIRVQPGEVIAISLEYYSS